MKAFSADLLIKEIIPAIRARLTQSGVSPIVRFTQNEKVSTLGQSQKKFESALDGIAGIYIDETEPDKIVNAFSGLQAEMNFRSGLVLIKNFGLLGVGSSLEESLHFLNEFLKGSTIAVPENNGKFGRVHNKIFIITGGAMGIGRGIAEELIEEGGYMIIAEINKEEGEKTAGFLNGKIGNCRASYVDCDVTDPVSVQHLVTETVKAFGGLDVLISNAGILKAGSLDEMDEQSFDRVTGINYRGFFICSKYCVPVMKLQYRNNPLLYMDIIQINSKSGLAGSNKNFAYAGSKFGSIGLVQSFALELTPYHIKINAICPGNYFEGPLWSDPKNGLFAQYLNTGKVPGAKNISDVKKHYEALVPMGRGCMPGDIVKAIYYLIEQEYETGQAVPVTGGQLMLN